MAGNLMQTIGTPGMMGRNEPLGVWIDRCQRVFIADHRNWRVLVVSGGGFIVEESDTDAKPQSVTGSRNSLVLADSDGNIITYVYSHRQK